MFRKNNCFCICMKITMTAIIEKQRTFLYTQKTNKNAKRFLNKKFFTFHRARQLPFRFYIQKAIHLTLRDFPKKL